MGLSFSGKYKNIFIRINLLKKSKLYKVHVTQGNIVVHRVVSFLCSEVSKIILVQLTLLDLKQMYNLTFI